MTRNRFAVWTARVLMAAAWIATAHADPEDRAAGGFGAPGPDGARQNVQVGPRPFYLVAGMDDGALSPAWPVARTSASDGPISRSATAAPRCSFRSTPASPMRRPRAWAPASSSAT